MLFAYTNDELKNRPALWEAVHRLRYSVFVEEMGWKDLARPDGLEIDDFDHEDSIHHVILRDGELAGYQRLLPTTRPHLLTHVFSDLCVGTPPSGPNIYEVTRFAVVPRFRDGRRGLTTVGTELIAGFIEWGLSMGADRMVIETEPMWTLRMLQFQFLVTPLGRLKTYGSQQVVAMLLQFDETTLRTVRERRGFFEPVLMPPGRDAVDFLLAS